MKNNPVLDKNLNYISKYNPDLAKKVMNIDYLKHDLKIVDTLLREPNMMYDGVYLHNNYGAEVESREIFETLNNNSKGVYVLYGLGFGYLMHEFAVKSKGVVIVYEPNLEILAATLEIVDFSEEFANNNVFICSDFEILKKIYFEKYKYNSDTHIIFLPSYKTLFNKDLMDFSDKLNIVMGTAIINNNYIKQKLVPAVKSVCGNIDLLVNEEPLDVYSGIYKGKTAIIVSAGPSLDDNIETLKKYRKNVIIFSVGQAAKTLMNNGIKPDFLGLVETGNQMSQIEGLDISNINLILEPLTYRELHETNFKKILSYPSYTSVPNLIWSDFADIDSSPYVSSGTVSYMMLYSAKIMGFENIVLVGQDFAYIDGKCYTKDSCQTNLRYSYDEETGKSVVTVDNFNDFKNKFLENNTTFTEKQKRDYAFSRIDYINQNLYFVEGITGEKLPTTTDYASYIVQFSEFAKKYKDEINLYNTSLKGAKIDGFKDVPLEDIISLLPEVTCMSLTSHFSYNIRSIIANINKELKTLDSIQKSLKTAKSLISSFDKEFHNRNVINETCIKYFKQLLVIYIDLSGEYAKKSRLFMYIQKAYSLDLDSSMQGRQKITADSVANVYKYIKIYMRSLLTDVASISLVLKEKVGMLDEMLNTKG